MQSKLCANHDHDCYLSFWARRQIIGQRVLFLTVRRPEAGCGQTLKARGTAGALVNTLCMPPTDPKSSAWLQCQAGCLSTETRKLCSDFMLTRTSNLELAVLTNGEVIKTTKRAA